MTDVEIIQYLLDTDPEIKTLIPQLNTSDRDLTEPSAKEILSWRDSSPDEDVQQLSAVDLFAYFKGMLVWAVLIGKIWVSICGESMTDESKAIPLPGTTKKLLMYHYSPIAGGNVIFNILNKNGLTISVNEDFEILDDQNPYDIKHSRIFFTLVRPSYTINPNGTVDIDLKDSDMSIQVSTTEPVFIKVKDFILGKLLELIKKWY